MAELLTLAKQYFDELNALLPDTKSDIEAIRLTQTLRKFLDDSSISSDSDLIDAIYNIRKACSEYKLVQKTQDKNLLTILKIELKCTLFLFEAEKNTYFWNRHKGKIIGLKIPMAMVQLHTTSYQSLIMLNILWIKMIGLKNYVGYAA